MFVWLVYLFCVLMNKSAEHGFFYHKHLSDLQENNQRKHVCSQLVRYTHLCFYKAYIIFLYKSAIYVPSFYYYYFNINVKVQRRKKKKLYYVIDDMGVCHTVYHNIRAIVYTVKTQRHADTQDMFIILRIVQTCNKMEMSGTDNIYNFLNKQIKIYFEISRELTYQSFLYVNHLYK